jgi:kinesin family protein C2/C3
MYVNWILFSNRAVVCMQLLESMLSKLVDEFENRLNSQNDLVCLVSFAHYLAPCFSNPSTLLHSDKWHYVVLALLGNMITKINPLGQVKAALKNSTDSTKSFSKSKVLVEATPNFSGRKASSKLILFMLQRCF